MSNHPEKQYLDLLGDILANGWEKPTFVESTVWTTNERTSVFGRQMRFDLSQGFPLLTTKKVFLKGIIHELLWFLNGDSNVKYLADNNVKIWDDWAYKNYSKAVEKGLEPAMTQEEFMDKIRLLDKDDSFVLTYGELGPVYGKQWRKWKATDGREIDQIAWAIEKLRKTPNRNHCVISAWNPEYIYEMALPGNSMAIPPCHTLFQFIILDGKLSCQLYQRSADVFLGVPFNIASYALLTMMFAHVLGVEVGEFVHTLGDAHLYANHKDQAREQMSREPRPFPIMKLNPNVKEIDGFTYEDFILEGYDPHPPIKGDITVVGGF